MTSRHIALDTVRLLGFDQAEHRAKAPTAGAPNVTVGVNRSDRNLSAVLQAKVGDKGNQPPPP